MDELTPAQFDAWEAWSRLRPDAETRLAAILKLGFAAVCAAAGLRVDPETLDPLDPDKPPRGRREASPRSPPPEPAQRATPNEAAAWARAILPGFAATVQ